MRISLPDVICPVGPGVPCSGANLPGANLTGAGLSDALWIDGKRCKPGRFSVGRCYDRR